jgi:hypothetical protein
MQLTTKHEQFFKQSISQATGRDDWNWPSPLETDKVYRDERTTPFQRSISFVIKQDGEKFYMDYFLYTGNSSHHIRVLDSGKTVYLERYEPTSGYSTTGDLEKDRAELKKFVDHNLKVEQLLIEKGLERPGPYTVSLLPEHEQFFVEEINKITGEKCWVWPSPLKFGKLYRGEIFTAGSRGMNDIRFVINIDSNGVLYMDYLLKTDDYSSHNRVLSTGESIRLENYEGQWGRPITGDEEKDKAVHTQMKLNNEKVQKILKEKGLEF